MVVGVTVGALFSSIFLCVYVPIWRRRKSPVVKTDAQTQASDDLNVQLTRMQNPTKLFTVNELEEATSNFNPQNKLGEGGFGPVYRGRLQNGHQIAVKKLSSGSRQGKRQFLNEVSLITVVQHRNLVKLFGCCVEGSERFLVYEYLPKGSLDRHLFGLKDSVHLDWHTRREIIMGAAKGLKYLHEESSIRIVHRDIKASNILLDDNLNPKISDFGLARFFSGDETHVTTGVAGTLGYLAPEYVLHGELTEKADVFSFGLVCLEIVSGRRNTEMRLPRKKQRLLEWAWNLYQAQRQLELADRRLEGKFLVEEVVRVVHVALLCCQEQAALRPAMSRVVMLLLGRSQILEIPTKPAYVSETNHERPTGKSLRTPPHIAAASSSSSSSSSTSSSSSSSSLAFSSSSSSSSSSHKPLLPAGSGNRTPSIPDSRREKAASITDVVKPV